MNYFRHFHSFAFKVSVSELDWSICLESLVHLFIEIAKNHILFQILRVQNNKNDRQVFKIRWYG